MNKPKRILICGGRDFKEVDSLDAIMKSATPYFDPEFCIIHGGGRGADMLAHYWAFFQGCPVIRMDANWDFYGRQAGPVRNKWMLDYSFPDMVIALPGGPGTRNMIALAKERNIFVWEPLKII